MVRLSALLVDDDPVSHFINTRVLRHIGLAKIDTADNGQEALDRMMQRENKSAPDIIFVDLNMPVLDGFGLIEELKKLTSHDPAKIEIVVLTSSIDMTEKRRAEEMGISHFLSKPASEQDFRAVLEPLLLHHHH